MNKVANAENSADVKDIFAPLITDILRLINEQVNEVKIKRPGKVVTVRCFFFMNHVNQSAHTYCRESS